LLTRVVQKNDLLRNRDREGALPYPIPNSSTRSKGAPQILQMMEEQSPHTNGSVTAA
jgi:hypothetical protein